MIKAIRYKFKQYPFLHAETKLLLRTKKLPSLKTNFETATVYFSVSIQKGSRIPFTDIWEFKFNSKKEAKNYVEWINHLPNVEHIIQDHLLDNIDRPQKYTFEEIKFIHLSNEVARDKKNKTVATRTKGGHSAKKR